MNLSFFLLSAETPDLSDGDVTKLMLISFAFTLAFPAWLIFKWIWHHPHVNMFKLKERLEKSNVLKERLSSTEQLLIDLDLQNLEQYNIRGKGITIIWSDNVSGQDKQLDFIIDGKNDASKALRCLAKVVHKETKKELLKTVYKLPKRHGKSEPNNVITFHGIDD